MLIHFTVKPSFYLTLSFFMLFLGGLISLGISACPLLLKIGGIGLGAGIAYFLIRKYALVSLPTSIIHCYALTSICWELEQVNKTKKIAYLLGGSWRSQWLILLNFRLEVSKKRVSVLVVPDRLAPWTFRQLQVFLTIHSHLKPPEGIN